MHPKADDHPTRPIPFPALWPFLLIAFGWAWGIIALFIFLSGPMTRWP